MMTDYSFVPIEEQNTGVPIGSVPADDNSIFAKFKQEMNHPVVTSPTAAFFVEGRENFSVVYSTELDFEILNRYIQRHTNKKGKTNPLNLAYDLLMLLNRGFRIDGEDVTKDGNPILFTSDEFLQVAGEGGTSSSREGIKWLYGSDADIISTSMAVLEACGYSDIDIREDESGNPSMRS